MGQLLSTTNGSNDSPCAPTITPGLESRPTIALEIKGILKSPNKNQQNSDDKNSTNNQQPSPQHIQWSKVQWHFLPGGTKEEYILCGDCKFHTTSKVSLDLHIKEKHPIPTTTHQPQPMNKDKLKFHCVHCPFKARCQRDFKQHNSCHRNQAAKYQCPQCSYSVGMLCQLNQHLWLHSVEIDEDKSSPNFGDHQNPDKGGGELPIVSNNTNNNTGSDSRMLRMSLLRTDPGQGESRTRQKQGTITKSPIINENYDDKFSSNQSYSASSKRKEDDSPYDQRKRFKCEVCNYQTASKVSMDLHVELMHSISAITTTTTIEEEFYCALCPFKAQSQAALEQHAADYRYPMGVYSVDALGNLNHRLKSHSGKVIEDNNNSERQNAETYEAENHSVNTLGHLYHCFVYYSGKSIEDNNISHPQTAEKDDRSLPVLLNNSSTGYESKMRKQFGIKERSVTLHDIHSSIAKVVNPDNIELLPSEEDQSADVELEDERIKVLQSRLKIMEERALIAEEEVTQILSKKMDLQKKIIEMAERRLIIEFDLRSEQCGLLEMSISALDAGEDHSALTEPVDEKIKVLQKKMDAIDSQLHVLKEEEDSLAQDLDYARGSHVGVIQVIEALQSELDGLYCC